MEDNKLTYYVEINTEDGTQKALKKLMKFNKEAQDAIKGVTEKSSANDKVAGLKKQLDELSKTWDKYNASQRKGDAGSKTIKEFRELEFEAGAFAGRLRQVIKAQDEKSASATQLYAKLQALRKEWRELTAAELNGAKGRAIIDKYNEIMKSSAAAGLSLDSYVKKLQKQSAEHEKSVKAVTGLRSEIKNLETQWNKLTLTQQKGAEGQRLKNQIRALRDEYGKYGLSLKQTVINEDRVNSNRLKTQASANSLSGRIRLLTAEWNKLTAAQRSGAEGQRILAQFQRLNNEAGNYAGTLNQASKNQIKLATSTTATNTGLYRQSRIMSQLKSQIGMYVSVYALQRFATAVRDITAEFELQRVALTAILQDKAAADKIFGQVVELALESPFRIKNIISYTKQLAAYRVETDKLFDTTKRLADISAGLGVDMSRLILAYGQVRAASVLRGQELRQFTEAGIPLVKLLADKFTELRGVMVSTGEVFELISKRAVPFRMIEEIFNDMTDAGGMFYNMQKIQAETIHGVWANLKDAYDKMYYEIGQKNMGLLKGLGNFLRSLADNWEAVYISMKTVVSGYLSYLAVSKLVLTSTKVLTIAQIAEATASGRQVKATLAKTLSTTLATKAADLHTAAQLRAAVATNVLSRAFWKLTAAIMANPIAAAVAGVVVLGVAIRAAIIKANDLDNIIKKLSKSTSEYNKINDEIKPALETYGDLNKIAAKSEDQTKKQANALATLAQKYPAAITKVDEYGRAIEVSAEMVSKLMLAEEELEKQRIENSNKELLRQKAILVSKMNSLKADINSGYYTQTLSGREGGSQRIPMTPSLLAAWNKEIGELGVRMQKIDVALKGTGSAAAGEIEEALAGLKKYVFELESLEKRAGGNRIKLYDAEEDVSAFGSHIELLEDVAKKYDEANKHAKFYSEQVTNPKISESERETYKNDLRIANAEKELARNILDRYKALDLIKKLKASDEETENVKRLRDEINVAKDARSAYENYLKTMTEVRAKQTLEGQLKFAGLNFDISDAGAYRGYLQNIYDNIKGDPNYDAVRKLIEDIFVDLDTNAIERELKIKLNKIANDIEKTQKANDFFEKVLGITGDIELSKAITIKFTGVAAGEVGDKLREQLQETLQTALGDQALDISGLDILQIEELINKIPDTMTDVKDKAKSFFDKFSDYIRKTKIEALELDEQLKLLGMDDATLFGTGVVLDVQKVVRDLSMANKKLAKEKAQLEAEVAADGRANDKKWYDERMKYIDDSFRQQAANDKTLAQDKLNDLAKAYVEERLFQDGISELLQDVGDKTYSQLSRARKMLQSISDTELIKISDEGMASIESLGYTVDDLMKMESLDKVFLTLGEGISYADEQLISLLFNMNSLGLSAEDVEKLIGEILSGKVSNARVEELKKLSSTVNELSSGIAGILNDSLNLFAGDAPWVDGVQKAIDGFAKLTSAAVELGSEIARAAGKISEATSDAGEAITTVGASSASAIVAIIGAVIQIGSAIVSVTQAIRKAKLDKYFKDISDGLDGLKAKLDGLMKVSGLGDGWFTEDNFQKIRNLNSQINEVVKNLRDVQDAFSAAGEAGGKGSLSVVLGNMEIYFAKLSPDFYAFRDLLGELESVFDFPRNMESFDPALFRHFDLDRLQELKTELQELRFIAEDANYEALRDNLVSQIDLILESYENIKETIRGMVGDISGNMLSAVNTMWDEMRQKGIDTFGGIEGAAAHMAEALKKDVSEVIDQMVSQQLWATYMGQYFDQLGENLTLAIIGGGETSSILGVFDDFWDNMQSGLIDYTSAYEAFLQSAEAHGWDMRDGDSTADDFAPGSISELNSQLSELEEQWNALSQAEREAAIGLQLWNDILAKREEVEAAKSYYEYAAKLDEAVGTYDDLIEKAKFLNSVIAELGEGGERDYAQSLLDKTNLEIYANLYGQYITDAQKYNDELADMNKHMEWAIENGYPELAEWIQKAYDTKVLENWQAAINEIADDIDNDVEKYMYFQAELQKATARLIMAILSGDTTAQADWEEKIKWLLDIIDGLKGSITDNLWNKYATDAQKYEKELEKINQDLLDALDLYPELADEIADAFNTRVLEEWQDAWDDTFGDLDLNLEKLNAIEAALAEVGVPEISEEEARKGRDAALLSGDEEALNYYQQQLLMHMKINLLLEEREAIEDSLYNSYRSERQELGDNVREIENNIKAMEDLRDQATDPNDIAKWNETIQNAEKKKQELINNYLETSEEYKLIFGDLTNISEEAFRDAMAKIKKSIEESTDLTDEAKAEILKNLDAIGAGFDNLQGEKRINKIKQSFDDLVSVMNDTVSLMQSLGASDSAVQMLQGVIKVVEGYRDLKLAIEEADKELTALSLSNVFTSIVAVINGLIMALSALGVKLVQLVDVDSISGLAEAYDKLTYAISRSVGAQRLQKQEAARQNLEQQKAEVERALAREKAKWGFTLNLGIFGKYQILGPDQGAVNEMEAQLLDLNKALDQLGDTMKADFLQTDYASFSDSLAEILIQPWDSYMEMMDAVKELTDDTINNIVRHALSLHLQSQIKDALDALYERGIGDESLELFRQDVAKIVKDGQSVAKYYGQFYDDLASSSEAYDTISRITESQANSFLGYYQNYLIIMTDMHNIMKRIWDNMNRQSVNINLDAHLTALHTIAANTGAIANNTSRIGAMADDIKIMKNSLARSGAY